MQLVQPVAVGSCRALRTFASLTHPPVAAIVGCLAAQGSIMIGIVFVTVIAWIPGHAASYLGAESSIKGGQQRLDTFKQIVRAPSVGRTGLALDFKGFANGHVSNAPASKPEISTPCARPPPCHLVKCMDLN